MVLFRDVAQPGSALAWGARGRGFKSRRPDKTTELGTVSRASFVFGVSRLRRDSEIGNRSCESLAGRFRTRGRACLPAGRGSNPSVPTLKRLGLASSARRNEANPIVVFERLVRACDDGRSELRHVSRCSEGNRVGRVRQGATRSRAQHSRFKFHRPQRTTKPGIDSQAFFVFGVSSCIASGRGTDHVLWREPHAR
jgi:hypothetical protein